MISAGDFRNGVTFEMDGQVVSIIEFQHVKPGKGAAFVRTKIRNVITGAVVEKTFNPNDKYPTAFIDRKDMEYSYSDGDLYYFMDTETWEQIPIKYQVTEQGLTTARAEELRLEKGENILHEPGRSCAGLPERDRLQRFQRRKRCRYHPCGLLLC